MTVTSKCAVCQPTHFLAEVNVGLFILPSLAFIPSPANNPLNLFSFLYLFTLSPALHVNMRITPDYR